MIQYVFGEKQNQKQASNVHKKTEKNSQGNNIQTNQPINQV